MKFFQLGAGRGGAARSSDKLQADLTRVHSVAEEYNDVFVIASVSIFPNRTSFNLKLSNIMCINCK